MDPSAAPWRVIDEPVAGTVIAPPGGGEPQPVPATSPPWRSLAGLAIAAALAAGAFAMAAAGAGGTVIVDGSTDSPRSGGSGGVPDGTDAVAAMVVVDVQGAVLQPGVHRLAAGARVGDAIASAGGYGPRVDAERAARDLNLAQVLADGDRILVPSRDDEAPEPSPPSGPSGPVGGQAGSGGLVNVNTASAAELDELPGVGPVTAQKIIDARAEAPFATVDDLLARKVLGQSAFDKLRDLVTVR